MCKDYGSNIVVGANLKQSGVFLKSTLTRVPRDRKNNNIADAWEDRYGWVGLRADEDNENAPGGDGTRGGGLCAFDEYRGFVVEGSDYDDNEQDMIKAPSLYRGIMGYIFLKEGTAVIDSLFHPQSLEKTQKNKTGSL